MPVIASNKRNNVTIHEYNGVITIQKNGKYQDYRTQRKGQQKNLPFPYNLIKQGKKSTAHAVINSKFYNNIKRDTKYKNKISRHNFYHNYKNALKSRQEDWKSIRKQYNPRPLNNIDNWNHYNTYYKHLNPRN